MDEKKKKIIENVIVGVIVIGILIGVFALHESTPDSIKIEPMPTAVNGEVDFDKLLYWMRHTAMVGESQNNEGRAFPIFTAVIESKEIEYSIVFKDERLEDYKGELLSTGLIWERSDSGEAVFYELYYPVGRDDINFVIAELSNGEYYILSRYGWAAWGNGNDA